MPITTSKTELFTSGPISFSSLQSNFGGSARNIKLSKYLRDANPDNLTPVIPDAFENEDIPTTTQNIRISGYRNVVTRYEITQSGTDENLDISETAIVDESTQLITQYVGPWNGNLSRNVFKKFTVNGTCGATAVGRNALSLVGNISNLDFEVSDTGAIYGAGGRGGNKGDAPQTSIRTASLYHVFNNSSDQTLDNLSTGGIRVEVVNPYGPDGLKLNGDVTTSTALSLAKHYRIIFDNPYLNTNYTILITNLSEYTAGGGYGKPIVEGIAYKETGGFRVWFKRTVAPGSGKDANTYIRSFFVQTEGDSSGQLTPITFNLTTTSFLDGDIIGTPFLLQSAGGQNRTPQLSWSLSGLPSGVSVNRYELYLEDLSTANSFRHWELENISSSVSSISEGQTTVPLGATIVTTDYGVGVNNGAGYAGPNPPAGERHHYRLTLRAILDGSPSTPTTALEFYAGTGTLIQDKNSPTYSSVFDVVTGAGVNELGTNGGPGGGGGGAMYINNIRTSDSDSTKVRIKLNQNARVWAGGGGGGGGKPGKNGPVITCYSSFSFTNSPSTGGGGSRNCPGNATCPSGSSESGCNPNDVRARCRGASPRRGESGYICAGNWTRTCNVTSSNLTQGLGGSGGNGGVGRGYQNINASLEGQPGTSGNSNSCSGGSSVGGDGNPGGKGGEWGESGSNSGGLSGGRGTAIIVSTGKYRLTGDSTTNVKGAIRTI